MADRRKTAKVGGARAWRPVIGRQIAAALGSGARRSVRAAWRRRTLGDAADLILFAVFASLALALVMRQSGASWTLQDIARQANGLWTGTAGGDLALTAAAFATALFGFWALRSSARDARRDAFARFRNFIGAAEHQACALKKRLGRIRQNLEQRGHAEYLLDFGNWEAWPSIRLRAGTVFEERTFVDAIPASQEAWRRIQKIRDLASELNYYVEDVGQQTRRSVEAYRLKVGPRPADRSTRNAAAQDPTLAMLRLSNLDAIENLLLVVKSTAQELEKELAWFCVDPKPR